MSEEICHHDQDRLNYIFEQVKALSDVVDELRTEVNDLKKVSLNTKCEDILFECSKVNCEIDHIRPCVVDSVKTYFRNVRDLTATEEIRQLTEYGQVSKSDSTSPSYMVQDKRERDEEPPSRKSPPAKIILSIYDGLKSFKTKLVKIIHSVPAPQLFLRSTKDNCVKSNGPRQIRLSRKEEEKKFFGFDRANENDVSKCIDINEELDDSTDTSLTSDASAQVDITTCSYQEDDEKSAYSSCRDVPENDVQVPLSPISDNRFIIHSNWITGESSKGHVKRAFLKNNSKKYKICSCGSQCPYALYKLPCCNRKNIPEKRADDEVDGLTLECSSFDEKNNFPKFVNIEAEEYNKRLVDSGMNESSSSSLSVDLEVDICSNYGKPGGNVIDEFSKRRIMTYVMRGTSVRRNDDAISHCRTENKSPMCVNLEANQQTRRTKTKDFAHDYRLIKNDKQVQCSSATRAVRKMFVRTSTPDLRQNSSMNRSCRANHDTKRRMNFLKIITPRQVKMNIHTQTEKRSYVNRPRSIDLPSALNLRHERGTENIDEDGNKKILRKRNVCDLPGHKARLRTERYNTQFALRTKEDSESNLNKSWKQMGYFNHQRDGVTPLRTSCPYHCDRVLAEKHANLATLMSHFAEYHFPHRTLDFDMNNVRSGRLYGCLEKVEDINA